MNKEDIDLIIQEFSAAGDKWSSLALETLGRTFDLGIRNFEREFNLTLSLTTLSAAFLAIVVPLAENFLSISLVLTVIFFLLVLIVGITILLLTIKRDKRLISEDGAWMHGILSDYLNQAVQVRSKAYDYKKAPSDKLWDEVISEVNTYIELRKGLDERVKERERKKAKETSAIVLKYLKGLFWVVALLSFVFLVMWISQITLPAYLPYLKRVQ